MKFSYSNSTRIHFGKEQTQSIAKEIPTDKKVLLIYGGGSIKKNGVYDQVKAALADHQWIEFSGVEPNPTVETLDKAVALAKSEQVDYVLAVGGGSVIDGSKYVVAAALYDGDGWDIMTGKYRVKKALPLGVVLTLPATGSESNSGGVVTKKATQDKLPFGAPVLRPVFAVMDPDVMKTLPERQLINGIVDAWVHVCEQYLTYPTGAMVQDGYAETLLRNLKFLAEQYDQRDSDSWRENLMWTANQALNGLIGAGVPQDWATHMMGHEITALYGVDHARSLAMVHASVLRHEIATKREKLEQMGRNVFALDESDNLAEATIDAIEALYRQLDVATQLTDHQGDAAKAIDNIIQQLETHRMLKLGEHRTITLEQSREILKQVVA
ncbi:MAG: NADH-dependent alcohol dehydrogenase [Cellvibrionaceae bacterium]|nr:NADH-dependent alcohol dehydrogenase [Cellvibrionaceae bacterium]